MKVRKLDLNGDMTFGNNSSDFWVDAPDGVAQCVVTRMRLQLGEYFLNTNEGTPWKTNVLGKYTGDTRDIVLQTRILQTQGVREITSYYSALDRDTRAFKVEASINTIYGKAVVSGAI